MKQYIDVFDYSGQITKALKKGILLTTKADGKVNTMTIGWGMLGIEWGKAIFIALVRESRYTKKMLDKNGEFTVNIPVDAVDSHILGYCGTKSGADTDKISGLGLTLVESDKISVPGIKELPLTLECRVIYEQPQELSFIPADLAEKYYPQHIDGSASGKNRDRHIAYYAEIVNAYLLTE